MSPTIPPALEPAAGSSSLRQRVGFAWRVAWLRLRFVLAVAGLFLLIAFWQQLGAMWDRAVLWASGHAAERGVSPDTEYFCPMCPGVLSAWPEKCPVCKMPLVRRTKGQSQLLPEGVTARMQISPYRLQLAGIKTSVVGYMPLTHEIRAGGRVEQRDGQTVVAAPLNPWDVPFVAAGLPVEVRAEWLPAETGMKGTVERIAEFGSQPTAAHELIVKLSGDQPAIAGAAVQIVAQVPLASVEPFQSQPRNAPPLAEGSPRKFYVCSQHPTWLRAKAGKCPFENKDLEERSLRDDQRLAWSCFVHRDECHEHESQPCAHCERRCTTPRVVTYVPAGEVLVVPESAVIDTGSLQVVYVETMPGMFDGVIVELGAKERGYYPVLAGLEPGQRVASAGAFLLDAETRLNPALAAGYFGAGSTSATGTSSVLAGGLPVPSADLLATLKLTPEELILARRQKVCPITKMALGSMGELVRVEVEGEPVFLCCEGCRDSIRPESLTAGPASSATRTENPAEAKQP